MDDISKQVDYLLADLINQAINNTTGTVSDINDIDNINSEIHKLKAVVNKDIAEKVLERAKYYCPVDTGRLRDSGHIEYNSDGTCYIIFDAPYAFIVHESTWVNHEFPTSAKFLDRAVAEISSFYNIGV